MAEGKQHYSPLRYPGGKACIFRFMSSLIYENHLTGVSYAEPYAGGAGLALRLLFEGYVDKIYLNDIDYSVYSFWNSILNDTNDFCRWIEDVNVDIRSWHHYKSVLTSASSSSFEIAQAFFFLNRTNVSGIVKGGVIGGVNQTGAYRIDVRFNKPDLIARIRRIEELKDRIVLSQFDGIRFLGKLDKVKEPILVYVDPPYFCKGADLYMNFYTEKDHQKLSKKIASMRKPWLISYDNQPVILKLYEDHHRISYNLSQCASNRIGKEVLIFSSRIEYEQSMRQLTLATHI